MFFVSDSEAFRPFVREEGKASPPPPHHVPGPLPTSPGTYRREGDTWQLQGNANTGSVVLELPEPVN